MTVIFTKGQLSCAFLQHLFYLLAIFHLQFLLLYGLRILIVVVAQVVVKLSAGFTHFFQLSAPIPNEGLGTIPSHAILQLFQRNGDLPSQVSSLPFPYLDEALFGHYREWCSLFLIVFRSVLPCCPVAVVTCFVVYFSFIANYNILLFLQIRYFYVNPPFLRFSHWLRRNRNEIGF